MQLFLVLISAYIFIKIKYTNSNFMIGLLNTIYRDFIQYDIILLNL